MKMLSWGSALALGLAITVLSPAVRAEEAASAATRKISTVAEMTMGMPRRDGFVPYFIDAAAGKILLELPAATSAPGGFAVILGAGLTSGLGSNPVGLDRSLLGETRYALFRRVGEKLILEQPSLAFRADSEDMDERAAVRQSFATSVLWAAKILAQEEDGRILVDFTSFIVRDAAGVVGALERSGQGSFSLDADRSALDPDAALSFPDNIEFEALLTFAGKNPGPLVRETAPSPESITLVVHHSLIRPPDDGYHPRAFDPRAGALSIRYLDYATPLDKPIEKQWIVRHRLEKTDPHAARSRVKKPIVYYVDRGAPEPVRSALIAGASWWARAFEEAGFIDAYRVELLPMGAHPLDVRYNVIHWVHRSTRGWSYGSGMTDPRTGEMMKGNVLLGSQRIRHDRLLFEGLAGTAKSGTGSPDDPVTLALARIRQLAAHEVGHTLGFTHNFAASTYGRESVMDYPAPLIKVRDDGTLDFGDAYAKGVGSWDRLTVRFAYTQFEKAADEQAGLEAIVQEGIARGLLFLTDNDARPDGAAHPLANLWDNGSDPLVELDHVMRVRRIALDHFGAQAIAKGRPLALLGEALMPVYFHHRYQLDATAKMVGGLEYAYALRGDGLPAARTVSPSRQRSALLSVLRLLDPLELDLREEVLALILPRPFGYDAGVETPATRTAPAFDALGLAATAASSVVSAVLQPERAARVIDQHRRDPQQPSLAEVIVAVVDRGLASPLPGRPRLEPINAEVRRAVADGLLDLAVDSRSTSLVRGEAEQGLRLLADRLKVAPGMSPSIEAQDALIVAEIARFLDRPVHESPARAKPASPPPGSPIGSDDPEAFHLWGCSLQHGDD